MSRLPTPAEMVAKDDTTWHGSVFGFGELRIKYGHWRDKNGRAFTRLMYAGSAWWAGVRGEQAHRIQPTDDLVRLYVSHLSIDKTLRVQHQFDSEIKTTDPTTCEPQSLPVGDTIRFNERLYRRHSDNSVERQEPDGRWTWVISADQNRWGPWERKILSQFGGRATMEIGNRTYSLKPDGTMHDLEYARHTVTSQPQTPAAVKVQKSTELKVSDKPGQPVTMSVPAYGRAYSHGLRIHLVGAKFTGRYRRNTNGVVEYFDDTTVSWSPSSYAPEADQALTAAGWPKDFEIESVAGPYVPTPLEGTWTRFYWRVVETTAHWCNVAQWLVRGPSERSHSAATLYGPRSKVRR